MTISEKRLQAIAYGSVRQSQEEGVEMARMLLAAMDSKPVNDVTAGKQLTITLPDISSKAFWSGSGSGSGKAEVFHQETYKRWVKEAIERDCCIAQIDVKVK